MDQKTYEYKDLDTKYDEYSAPFFSISVGGKVLSENGVIVTSLEVEQSADGRAGGCSFVIDGQYNHEHSKWENQVLELIKPGAILEIRGGYVRDKVLFFGYIDDYTIEFEGNSAPRLSVSGLDGLGYLMSFREPMYAGQRETAAIVKSILQKSVSAGVANKVTIGNLPNFETPILKEQVDDWKFLNLMARRCGVTLFALDGELIFDNVASRTTPIMTLARGRGLMSFRKQVSLAHQVGKVLILGRDAEQNAISGQASTVSLGGTGKTAVQLFPDLSKTALREFSEFVRTQEECTLLAQSRLDSIAMGLVSGGGTCLGIPELIPGRYVKIDGLDSQSNGTYFVTKVRHLFEQNGYHTSFEIKGARA